MKVNILTDDNHIFRLEMSESAFMGLHNYLQNNEYVYFDCALMLRSDDIKCVYTPEFAKEQMRREELATECDECEDEEDDYEEKQIEFGKELLKLLKDKWVNKK